MKFSAPLALLALSLPMAFASPVARGEEVKKSVALLPACTLVLPLTRFLLSPLRPHRVEDKKDIELYVPSPPSSARPSR